MHYPGKKGAKIRPTSKDEPKAQFQSFGISLMTKTNVHPLLALALTSEYNLVLVDKNSETILSDHAHSRFPQKRQLRTKQYKYANPKVHSLVRTESTGTN